ncbi:hypothetical protein [Vreelandella populi]|uniref:Uncharacterized protein n=1 Tax=Vreelandella populi TaxID=2498858 RepID=A0A3S1E785_9GAMM|nr:hypothetical protein [Halomonas populi]RUR39029.1 hypothetical protein ELY25_05105 [Halomonas populi]RUR46089.1 hypothetical protein ELY37_08840 [Halomonas populi]
MSEKANANVLGGQVGDHFSYRHFETGSSPNVDHQQRWKLLESIANQAPGLSQKGLEPLASAIKPSYLSPVALEKDSLHVQEKRAEPVQSVDSSSIHDGTKRTSPLSTSSQKPPFDHLFKAYSGSVEEPEHNDHKKASLKSLLRQINS